ncbi:MULTISPECIES: limonene-1,2-epoxide hydrolase family protein [Euryhalocaulis]|uniref:limonene-1,2-epoxide hydrolase family protein n=1 Tax=Euryhalocaulis TaxID=1712422 RepID=UPI0003A5BE5A|nr:MULTISPECIES: limonene-1,2-epoxide hydrolase family protein [Euryhalocaulis]MBA4800461.1 nuclear transport factor 2 family protein [Euryhalocaulis sp.]
MRNILGGVAALAVLAIAAPAFADTDEEKLAVANEMIQAWNDQDWDKVVDLFAEDGSLHSMMVEPIVGREAIGNRIGHMAEGIEEIELKIQNLGVIDGVVFMERIDDFTYNGHAGEVPVVGVVEIEDGKVQEWREYYDRAELLEAMGVETDFDSEAR